MLQRRACCCLLITGTTHFCRPKNLRCAAVVLARAAAMVCCASAECISSSCPARGTDFTEWQRGHDMYDLPLVSIVPEHAVASTVLTLTYVQQLQCHGVQTHSDDRLHARITLDAREALQDSTREAVWHHMPCVSTDRRRGRQRRKKARRRRRGGICRSRRLRGRAV